MNSNVIQQALAPLIGLPFRCIGRAADLLWVHLGEMRQLPDPKGGTRTVGERALHVQSMAHHSPAGYPGCQGRSVLRGRMRDDTVALLGGWLEGIFSSPLLLVGSKGLSRSGL